MKTSPARWYRNPLPQVDGWWLHCLLGPGEPAMAAIVEPFRDIIMAGPPGPAPEAPALWNSTPDPLGDFLAGYHVATTGKPWCPIGFRCPDCGAERPNPEAVHPANGFRSIYNQVAPKRCDACAPRRRSPYLRDRLANMSIFRGRASPLPTRPKARCSNTTCTAFFAANERRHVNGLPPFFDTWPRADDLEIYTDDSIPDGIIEIDGTRITLDEMRAACEGP